MMTDAVTLKMTKTVTGAMGLVLTQLQCPDEPGPNPKRAMDQCECSDDPEHDPGCHNITHIVILDA